MDSTTEWITAAVAALAALLAWALWRQRTRLLQAEARVAAVRAALPGAAAAGPVDAAVRDLAERADGCAERLGIVEQAVDASPIGLMMLDGSLTVAYLSATARAMIEAGEAGQVTMARVRTAAESVLAAGEARDERVEMFGRRRRVLRLLVAPVPGRPDAGVAVHLVDVTEREQVEAMRRDFVANVSHELKTPVGALAVLAEALADADDPATRKRLAGRVQAEASRMSALVKDLLDLSQVESEEPEAEPVDVGDVIGEAARRVAVVADASGVAVRTEPPLSPLTVSADRRQLVTAVSNLLDNAVAHSLPGAGVAEVVVRAALFGDEAVIEVEDHGVGIQTDEQDRIFERFYRVDRGRARQRGGTGLGLAIVRHVALSHGGTVEVESAPGAGATFRLRIPVGAA